MLGKLKKLFTDNRLKDLLSGNMVLSEEVINEFILRVGLFPEFSRLMIHCKDGVIGIDAEGSFDHVNFKMAVSAELFAVKINSKEQIIQLMPTGRARVTTENADVQVTLEPGTGLLSELESLLKYLPLDLAAGFEVKEQGLTLLLHKYSYWSAEFNERICEIPVFKEFGVNILDHVVIDDLRIEDGAIRVFASRI